MRKIITLISILLTNLCGTAQQAISLEEFLSIVRRYHPVAKQAELGVEIARAEVTSARGAFDPRFENTIAQKKFDGLLYYDHQISEVKIPTWFGVDVMAGVEHLSGERTSTPETKGNSNFIGFSVPVAKGLLIDDRRAALQKAKIFQQLSLQERRAAVNDLLFDAAKAYWNWWEQVQQQLLFQEAIRNAEQRFHLVKTAFQIGERPAIDTVEALAQLQGFQLRAAEIQLELYNAQQDFNLFLWQQNGQPYTLPQTVTPKPLTPGLPENMLVEIMMHQLESHPELIGYEFKLRALDVDKRLKAQSLLPSVYLKYNQLSKSHRLLNTFGKPWFENNYRYGAAVSIPLRLSEGRGDYRKAKLKIEQTKLEQANKKLTLQTKLRQYYNEWRQLQEQITLQKQALQSYSTLQRGEELQLRNGESSLFLVNARQQKTLEAQQKLVQLRTKEQKSAAGILWTSGNTTVPE